MSSLPSNLVPDTQTPPLSSANPLALQQLERILESPHFRDSPTLQKLLRHIVTETLAGNGQQLKEYNLALAVFHRGVDFDPRSDSLVRVQVRILRKKLDSYYKAEGADDELRIEIPRGHYSAEFLPAAPPEPPLEEPKAAAPVPGGSWIRLAMAGGVGLVLGIALWILFQNSVLPKTQSSAAAFPGKGHLLWQGFFDDDSNTQLVMGAPFFFNLNGTYMRDSEVNTEEELARSAKIQNLAKLFSSTPKVEEIYTGLGEAAGLYTLGRFFSHGDKDLPLVRNRLARWHDLASGNLVVLSSIRFRNLTQELHLPSDFVFDPRTLSLRNLRPAANEEQAYRSDMANHKQTYEYALASVWPSPQAGRRIMVLSGIYTWGTQGAAEYVTDPVSLRTLSHKLEADKPAKTENAGIQIVLKVLVKDQQPIATNYVTHHWIASPPKSAN